MIIKQNHKFASKTTGNVVKVTKVKRAYFGLSSKYDVCTVADTSNGLVIKGTSREIFADSIRRNYLKVD